MSPASAPPAPRPPGKPCYDCDADVPMARVRVLEAEAIAEGRRPVIRCRGCEAARAETLAPGTLAHRQRA